MHTPKKIIRGGLVIALTVLAGALGWVAWTRFSGAGPGGEFALLTALLPMAAAALLLVPRNTASPLAVLGAALAIIAALLAAIVGWAISFCLCPAPFKTESVALLALAFVVLALAVADLAAVGLIWVVVAIGLVFLWFANILLFVVASIFVAAVIIWRARERRGSDGAEAGRSPPPA